MSGDSYGGLKARINAIADKCKEGQGPLTQAITLIDDLIAEAQQCNEDSAALDSAIAALLQARDNCEQANNNIGQAEQETQTAAAQLQ